MTVQLSLSSSQWRDHIASTAAAYGPALVPVIKGNGYGFGRRRLHELAHEILGPIAQVCVGTVHELDYVPDKAEPVVLSPTLQPPPDGSAILTVGSVDHVSALNNWRGAVMVKLASSMRRFGATESELPGLLKRIDECGLEVTAFALHLPLAGDDTGRIAEVEAWLPLLPARATLWLSHLQPASLESLIATHSQYTFKIRVGTALWHGVPKLASLQLRADVLHTTPIRKGELIGYHHTPAPSDGTLVVVGAGSAHGVAPNAGGHSPFHFARSRIALLEAPHMHASLAIVEPDQPCPAVGDWIDVQRPLISTYVDTIEWQ